MIAKSSAPRHPGRRVYSAARVLPLMVGFALLGLSPVSASDGTASNEPPAQTPTEVLEDAIDTLRTYLTESGGDPGPELFKAEFGPYFDFSYMARAAAGPWYRGLDDDTRRRWRGFVQDDFMGVLYSNLKRLRGEALPEIAVRARETSGRYPSVAIRVQDAPGRESVRLLFRFHQQGASWQVFDVSLGGVSAVQHYRQRFQRGGWGG